MQLNSYFRMIDPLSGDLPQSPFPTLTLLAERARGMLGKRTRAEMDWAAAWIGILVDDEIDLQMKAFIKAELAQHGPLAQELAEDQRSSEGLRSLLERWPGPEPSPFMQTLDPLLRVDVLCRRLPRFNLDVPGHFPEGRAQEIFALLALLEIDAALTICKRRPETCPSIGVVARQLRAPPEGYLPSEDYFLRWAGAQITAAAAALTWAQAHEAGPTHFAVNSSEFLQQIALAVETRSKRRASDVARKAVMVRNAPFVREKEKLKIWYLENRHRYKSLDDAAHHIVHVERLSERAFTTVRKWLTEFQKDLTSTRTG